MIQLNIICAEPSSKLALQGFISIGYKTIYITVI